MSQMDTPEFFGKALQVYHGEVRKSIMAQEQRLQQLQTAHDQLKQTIDTVQELPLRLRHEVMVPLGKHAFFPGQITHTNELMVHLGDQYYVETTAAATRGILQRKLAVIAEGMRKAGKQLQSMQARLDVTQSSFGVDSNDKDAVEIRSSLEESDKLLASVRSTHRQQQQQQQAQMIANKHMQQQQQQQISRVTTAAGYSYAPIGRPDIPDRRLAAQQQQQGLDPDDLALQARLEQLMRLEEHEEEELQQQQWQQHQRQQQQEQQWQQQQWQQHQQQQQQQQQQYHHQQYGSLATIDEGDEDQDNGQAAAGLSMLDAAQRLQQLEAETDSDDDDYDDDDNDSDDDDNEEQYSEGQQERQLQNMQQPEGGVNDKLSGQSVQQQQRLLQQQERQQQQQLDSLSSAAIGRPAVPLAPSQAAAAAATGEKPLKSALKKGFLTAAAPKAQQVGASDNKAVLHRPMAASSSAFTGAVVERSALSEQAAADFAHPPAIAVVPTSGSVGAVMERPIAAPGRTSSEATDNSNSGRVSKFKLRRMGLEPPAE